MKQETKTLLAILEITERKFDQLLYELSEAWEDMHDMQGMYQYPQFRNWWMLRAEQLIGQFEQCIHFTEDHKVMVHYRDERGDHFIYGLDQLRKSFKKFISRLVFTPYDPALMMLINRNTKQKAHERK